VQHKRRWPATLAAGVCALAALAHARETLSPEMVRQNLFATCFTSRDEGWVVGELGRALRTTDGGKTFVRTETGTARGLLAIACREGSVIVVGQLGLALRSRDGGKTWETLETGTKRTLLSIAFATPEIGVAIGDYGTIIRTEDGGGTWKPVPMPAEVRLPEEVAEVVPPGDVLLYDIAFTTPERGVMVGEFGTIFLTEDAGRSWQSLESPVESTLFGVGFADAQRGWAVGLESIMVGTTDGGLTWKQEEIPAPKGLFLALYDVAVSGPFGWAVGDRGLLMQTSDGGATWQLTKVPIRFRGDWFRGVTLLPDATGFIVGNRGIMLATERAAFRELGTPEETAAATTRGNT
jgi:photosystem II stability/assembly factor-like uncharacterized protein